MLPLNCVGIVVTMVFSRFSFRISLYRRRILKNRHKLLSPPMRFEIFLPNKDAQKPKIEEKPGNNHFNQSRCRNIFVNHQEIVSKIEISFLRIFLIQRCASHVVDYRCRNAFDFLAARIEPPTQIDFFHVGKKSASSPLHQGNRCGGYTNKLR